MQELIPWQWQQQLSVLLYILFVYPMLWKGKFFMCVSYVCLSIRPFDRLYFFFIFLKPQSNIAIKRAANCSFKMRMEIFFFVWENCLFCCAKCAKISENFRQKWRNAEKRLVWDCSFVEKKCFKNVSHDTAHLGTTIKCLYPEKNLIFHKSVYKKTVLRI